MTADATKSNPVVVMPLEAVVKAGGLFRSIAEDTAIPESVRERARAGSNLISQSVGNCNDNGVLLEQLDGVNTIFTPDEWQRLTETDR